MEAFIKVLILVLGLSGSLALHIIMSPDEAEKIMKRKDEFSKGLAGFVDKSLKSSDHRSDNMEEILKDVKKLLSKKDDRLHVSVEEKSAPPALPLDTKKSDSKMADLENMVDKLLRKVNDGEISKRGCVGHRCMTNWGKKDSGKHDKEADNIDRIYQNLKRLVDSHQSEASSGSAKKSAVSTEDLISDSGDVGDRMLAKVRDLVKQKSKGMNVKIFEDSDQNTETRSSLEAKVEKLLHKVSQLSSKKDTGDLALNMVKEMIEEKKKRKDAVSSKVNPVEGQGSKDTLSDVKKELTKILQKLSSDKKDAKPSANDVTTDDTAIEATAKKEPATAKGDKGRQMILDLLKAYDAMKMRPNKDVYARELENASKGLKKDKTHAELVEGFGKSPKPHPK